MAITLTVNGTRYQRWTSVAIKRGLMHVAAGFMIETPGEIDPPILPFNSCVLGDDADTIVTGHIDRVEIEITARGTRTRIAGRSKTADLVDCSPVKFTTNQFDHTKLDAIARAVAGVFGINVVIGPGVNVGGAFADATFTWSETAYRFLERLARQRGVLLTDDPQGDLVIATLGTASAPAPLATGPGGNVFAARGVLDGAQRFSVVEVRSQAGMVVTGTGEPDYDGIGYGYDQGVPRYRPKAEIAESALVVGDCTLRAQWEASHRAAEAVTAVLSVPEWRGGTGGPLWQVNELVHCTVPRLALNGTMLIGGVEFREDERGRRTELTVALPAAFSPEPLAASDQTWAGVPNVSGSAAAPSSGAGPAG